MKNPRKEPIVFVPISNSPRDYAWGAVGAISQLPGWDKSSKPEAELWLGVHPESPAGVVGDPGRTLRDVAPELPFLLKVLAAGEPLSLQVHPSKAQAVTGFARENEAGLALDDSTRLYRDENHKPEMIVALEDGFRALCGIRPLVEREAMQAELGSGELGLGEFGPGGLDLRDAESTTRELLVGRGSPEVADLVNRVAAKAAEVFARSPESKFAESYRTVAELSEAYPGDPGVIVSLLMNHVTLGAGEALFLPAGNLHAYLRGIGVEVMANSDNVLRGGLTPKHIDVEALLQVAKFDVLPIPFVQPVTDGSLTWYQTEANEFELAFVRGAAEVGSEAGAGAGADVTSMDAIVLGLDRAFELESGADRASVSRGEALFVRTDQSLTFSGSGLAVLARARR